MEFLGDELEEVPEGATGIMLKFFDAPKDDVNELLSEIERNFEGVIDFKVRQIDPIYKIIMPDHLYESCWRGEVFVENDEVAHKLSESEVAQAKFEDLSASEEFKEWASNKLEGRVIGVIEKNLEEMAK